MEKKTRLTFSLLMIATISTSCSGSPKSTSQHQAPAKLVSQTTTEVAQATPATPPTPAPTPQPQATQTKPLPKPTIPGLIPSTNADSRRTKISKQRPDPFSTVSVPFKIVPIQQNPQLTKPPTPPPTTPVAEAPKKPQPDLARQVVISGVIDLNGKPQLIVKAPNEPYSRYVQQGQYLSNGKVLIKKVKMIPNSTPIVILEQSGMEVIKRVGETT